MSTPTKQQQSGIDRATNAVAKVVSSEFAELVDGDGLPVRHAVEMVLMILMVNTVQVLKSDPSLASDGEIDGDLLITRVLSSLGYALAAEVSCAENPEERHLDS